MKTIIKYIILLLFLISGIEDILCQPGQQQTINIEATNCSYVTFADVKKVINLQHKLQYSTYYWYWGSSQITDDSKFYVDKTQDLYYYNENRNRYDIEISFKVVYPSASCPSTPLSVIFSGQKSSGEVKNRLEKEVASQTSFCSLNLSDRDNNKQYNEGGPYIVTYYLNGSSTGCTANVIIAKQLKCPEPAISLTFTGETDKEEVADSLVNLNKTKEGFMLLDLDASEPASYKPSSSLYTIKYYLNASSSACSASALVKTPIAYVSYCKNSGVYNVTYPSGYNGYYLSITSDANDDPVWGKVPDDDGKFAFKNPLGESATLHLGYKKTAVSSVKPFLVDLTTIAISTGSLSVPEPNADYSYTFTDPMEISVTAGSSTTHLGTRKWYVFSADEFPSTKQPTAADFPDSPTKVVSEVSYEINKTFTTSISGCGQWVAVVDEYACCADTVFAYVPKEYVINCPNYNLAVDNTNIVTLALPTVSPEASATWQVVSFKHNSNDIEYSQSSTDVSATLPVGSSSISYKTTLCGTEYTKECPIYIVKKADHCNE